MAPSIKSPPTGRNFENKEISLAIRAKWLKQNICFLNCLEMTQAQFRPGNASLYGCPLLMPPSYAILANFRPFRPFRACTRSPNQRKIIFYPLCPLKKIYFRLQNIFKLYKTLYKVSLIWFPYGTFSKILLLHFQYTYRVVQKRVYDVI